MNFSLIICTYMRPEALLKLLKSVKMQNLYPNEILIIDGSTNTETKEIVEKNKFENLKYYLVSEAERGLTKQRNYGVKKVADSSEIVCFLDDDIILEPNYFYNLVGTYKVFPKALGVGGYIINEAQWESSSNESKKKTNKFYYDGYCRKEATRFVIRKRLGLDSNVPPGFSPLFSHGRSIGFLPPSGKIYEVEQLMGGVSSFRKDVFKSFQFSTYFFGYGLYEDADFTLRLSKTGKLFINTNAKLGHYHDDLGRPNKYNYGKMVVRNGWYVWRVKNPKPNFEARAKWNLITLLLIVIRFSNIFTTKERLESFTESMGRAMGWLSLSFDRPKKQ